MATHSAPPTVASTAAKVSIVNEWANLSTIEVDQARDRLRVLSGELDTYPGAIEVIFAFPAEASTETQVRGLVAELGLERGPARVAYVPSSHHHYYQLKNAGAHQASGEILVFVDCDVFVEAGWLQTLVAPFSDSAVEVVCGATHLGPLDSLWARLVALCWIYAPRSADDRLLPVRRFWSHSVAFRRATFLANPFPDEPRYRGADATMAEGLLERGSRIWRASGARTIHPPPQGLGAFLARAIQAGSSYAIGAVLAGRRPGLVDSVRNVGWRLRRAWATSLRSYRQVGLGVPGALGAMALGSLYWGVAWVSYLWAAVGIRTGFLDL